MPALASTVGSTVTRNIAIQGGSSGGSSGPVNAVDVIGIGEVIQDQAAAMITAGTHTGVTIVYDDANNRLNFTVTATGGATTSAGISDFTEAAQDAAAALLAHAGHSGVSVAYEDTANRIVLTVPQVTPGTTFTEHAPSGFARATVNGKTFVALPTDANGNARANIGGRRAPLATLMTLVGIPGEIATPTDFNGFVCYTGEAGGAFYVGNDAYYIDVTQPTNQGTVVVPYGFKHFVVGPVGATPHDSVVTAGALDIQFSGEYSIGGGTTATNTEQNQAGFNVTGGVPGVVTLSITANMTSAGFVQLGNVAVDISDGSNHLVIGAVELDPTQTGSGRVVLLEKKTYDYVGGAV